MFRFMNKMVRNRKGFTLIELIVVVAILGILALIVVPRVVGYAEKGKISADQTLAQSIASACAIYVAETSPTPTATSSALLALVAGANLIDSSLTTEALVGAKLKSALYTGITVAHNTTTHEITVTLTGATPFVVVK